MRLLVAAEPAPTGDARLDALLAATAEDLCVHVGVRPTGWVHGDSRFMNGMWWVSDLPSAWASALVHTPVYDQPNLRVMTAPAAHLLAMEGPRRTLRARCERHPPLLDTLELDTIEQVTGLVERYFPDEPLTDRSRLLVEDLLVERDR